MGTSPGTKLMRKINKQKESTQKRKKRKGD
jgi:hypothetical protein